MSCSNCHCSPIGFEPPKNPERAQQVAEALSAEHARYHRPHSSHGEIDQSLKTAEERREAMLDHKRRVNSLEAAHVEETHHRQKSLEQTDTVAQEFIESRLSQADARRREVVESRRLHGAADVAHAKDVAALHARLPEIEKEVYDRQHEDVEKRRQQQLEAVRQKAHEEVEHAKLVAAQAKACKDC